MFYVPNAKFCCRGEDARAEELLHEIQELDERAKELDKLRSSSISSISYINERNRKKNVEEAEKAILVRTILPIRTLLELP